MLPVIINMSVRDFKKRLESAKGKAKKAQSKARQINRIAKNTTYNEARAMLKNARILNLHNERESNLSCRMQRDACVCLITTYQLVGIN